MSQLALEIIAKEKEEKTGILDLGNCGLNEIPEEVFELIWLTELTLSSEYKDFGKNEIVTGSNRGIPNRLSYIPASIKELKLLETLRLDGENNNRWNISDISMLNDLPLKILSISYNQISKLENLPNTLNSLAIYNNKISKLENLPNTLNSLYIYNNKISKLKNLPNTLNSLNIFNNNISKLENLPNSLNSLIISFNQISKLENLPNTLNSLVIFNNNISKLENLPNTLNSLVIYNNKISKLENLPNILHSLDISSNQISKLENLPNTLNLLVIRYNQIGKLENLPNNLNSLDVNNNKISKLENLPNNLNSLVISSNQINKIENLPNNLNSLVISFSQINKLENLPKTLNSLDISYNQISKLENLPNTLNSLDINNNQIRKLENLPNTLNSLVIFNNKISRLENLPESLNSLNISSNHISKLENLPNSLNSLNINSNHISKLENLPEALNSLDISDNQISKLENLPEALNSLLIFNNNINKLENLPESLNSLYIGFNQISRLENLPQSLNLLDIGGNQISRLENLPESLNSLSIFNNKISKLENLPQSLSFSDISGNQIEDLSSIKDLIPSGQLNPVWKPEKYINELILENNPLTTPPLEIVKKGSEAVINYFKELEEQGTSYLFEAKILVIGDARAGKTTLCEKLKDINAPLPKEEKSTRGIDIFSLTFRNNGNEINANIWDFGGQEIYHSTHQFFLTKRSLYIFVDDNSRDDIEYDYWFQVIELLSSKSPVIVVQNRKADRHKEFDTRGYKHRFENIKEVFSIDLSLKTSEDKEEFQKLEKAIQYELSTLPHIGQELPKQWVEIRKKIGELAQTQPTLSLREYYAICEEKNIKERDRALNLSSFLHDLGVFLHFQEDDLLQKTVIIQKEWATNAVYKILDDKQVEGKHGRFSKNDAINIWKKSDYEEMYAEFLGIMRNFELIYTLADSDGKEFLIPKMLPVQQPVFEWDYNHNIQMKFEYDFMPKGLISRFIVRQHRHIKNLDLLWRKGVILERNHSKALVKEDYTSKKIEVWAKGPFAKDLMTIIKDDFDTLHKRFEGLKVEKLIPCNCSRCANNKNPYFFNYESLLRRIEKEKPTIECDYSYEDVSVKELLEGIFVKNVSEEQSSVKTKIFISYSKYDDEQADKLKFYFNQFKDTFDIDTWYDGDLNCGDEWDPEIKKQLNNADLIIFLISNSFLSTPYIRDIEIKSAIERHDKGEVKLLPVILKPSRWRSTVNPLRKIVCYPDKEKSIADYKDEDEGWTIVLDKIEEFLEQSK